MMSDRTKLSEALDWVEHGKPMKDGTALSERQGLITQAARKYLALMPDEDGNHDPELVEQMAIALRQEHHPSNTFGWETVDDRTKTYWRGMARAVLRAVTGDTK